jgi:translation initiation factor IF-2
MSSKLRVYEVARDLGMDNKELAALLQSIGFSEIKNHMSVVPPEAIERAKRQIERRNEPNKGVEERIRPTVVKRRAVVKRAEDAPSTPSKVGVEAVSPVEPVVAVVHEEPRPTPVVATVESHPAVVLEPKAQGAGAVAPVHAVPEVTVAAGEPAVAHESPFEPQRTQEAPEEAHPQQPLAEAPAAPRPVAQVAEIEQPTVAVVGALAADAAELDGRESTTAHLQAGPASLEDFAGKSLDASAEPSIAVVPEPLVEPVEAPATPASNVSAPAAVASASKASPPSVPPTRPSSPPRTGIEVWEGRPGVPMGPAHRAPVPRRVQYDPKAGANAAQRRPGQPGTAAGARGPMARGTRGRGPGGMGGPAGGFGRGGPIAGRGVPAPVVTQERGAHKRVVRIESSIGLQTLAGRMGIKAHELLRKLIMLGMTGVNINSTLDADTAKICASEFGWDVEDVAVSEEQALVMAQGVETEVDLGDRAPRPPVVTVMGHVDHGKTSLLDRIRKANVVAGEAGGITQHIGAYSVDTPAGRITFLDTPGHEAFTAMRARGAQTTDIVILVVAADDGVMPQTKEAVSHAKLAKVPIVVAINKCDKPEAQPERCRRELSELGLVPEEWGGEALFAEVSAQTGQGIDSLLEKVLLQAEMLDLRANPNKPAVGVVLEAQLDRGRGPVATLLITDGTLQRGDVLLAGAASGKVRALLDSMGRSLGSAGPATPVEVIGLNDVPAAGDPIHVVKDIKKAQEIADSRKTKERRSLMPGAGPRLTLEELYKAMKETEQLELKVIVKGDVHGSVEAVSDALVRLSTDKVKVTVVNSAAGAITEGDVNLAVAAGSIIIGFNVRPAGKAAALAAQEKIEIRHYNIIYNVVDDVKAAMEGLLSPSLVEKALGQAQVRQVFRVSKAGNVAGCMVVQGVIRRSGTVKLMRDGVAVWSGKLSSLKRFKDDAREVKEGFDCGIALDGFQEIKEGDLIECFEMEEVRQTL